MRFNSNQVPRGAVGATARLDVSTRRTRGVFTAALAALVLAGCGMEEADFVEEYTQVLCRQTMQCGDLAVLRFDGILDEEDCYEYRQEDVATWGVGCRYRARFAETCLAEMENATCPAGSGIMPARPTSCDSIYVRCEDLGAGGPPDDLPGPPPSEVEDGDDDDTPSEGGDAGEQDTGSN